METNEGNELIAVFDGWVLVPMSENCFTPAHYERGNDWENINGFCYHKSWDKLIPVLEKIRIFFNSISPIQDDLTPHIIQEEIEYELIWYDIEKVWVKSIEFIKWYNEKIISPK